MKKAAIPAVLALMLLDLLVGSSHAVILAQTSDEDVDIDSDVDDEDRALMVERMRGELQPLFRRLKDLQPLLGRFDRRRVQVLHIDARGRPHSNRRWLRDAYRPTQGTPNDVTLQDPYTGQLFVPAPLPSAPGRSRLFARSPSAIGLSPFVAQAAFIPNCAGDGTGPFRGVFTIDGTAISGSSIGFNSEDAIIFLPGKVDLAGRQGVSLPPDVSVTSFPSGDTGYVFGGGIGRTNKVVDAGLQYNANTDNYGLFYRPQAQTQKGFPPGGPFLPWRFQPNQNVFFMFFGAGAHTIVVGVDGLTQSMGREVEVLSTELEGFDFTGRGMHLMRITSIAQRSDRPNQFNTGSFFGPVRWQQADLCCATFFQGWKAVATAQPTCWHGENGSLADMKHVITTPVPRCISFVSPFFSPVCPGPGGVNQPFIQDDGNEGVTIDLRNPPPPPPGGCPPVCPNIVN